MRAVTDLLRVRRRTLDHPDAQALVAEVQAEYVEIYGSPDSSPIDPEEFAEGRGCFLVAHLDGLDEPVGSGAWRWIETPSSLGGDAAGRTVELKRMFVRRPHRRGGLARQVLHRLEESAREAGATFVVLETGPLQAAAVALYRSTGFVDLADFGHYRHMGAHAFSKRLT